MLGLDAIMQQKRFSVCLSRWWLFINMEYRNYCSYSFSFFLMTIFRWRLLNGGVKCRWIRQKSRFWAEFRPYRVLWTILAATVSSGLCWWRQTTTKCNTTSLNVKPKTTQQYLIVPSGKSKPKVINNTRLRSTYCTIESNNRQTRSIARSLCNRTKDKSNDYCPFPTGQWA